MEPGAFCGFDIAAWFPYHPARTRHLLPAISWIATALVARGLFLAPAVGGIEPKGRRAGALVLLAAPALVVFGSLFGEALGLRGANGKAWFWFGHRGPEHPDLGRFRRILLAAGLVLWLVLLFRAPRPAMKDPRRGQIASLVLHAAVAIPVLYLPALLYGPRDDFAVIDNWRFWIIHLRVEGFFELFATVLVAVMFHHGHAAMFGVFGMLARGVLASCLRWLADDRTWERARKPVRVGFWGLNIGLALMVVIDLFPAGVLQHWDSLENGHRHARRLTYVTGGTFHALEWARIGADTVFLVLGVVPVAAATLLVVLRRSPRTLPVVQEAPPVNP